MRKTPNGSWGVGIPSSLVIERANRTIKLPCFAYCADTRAESMAKTGYLTAPIKTDKMPPGVPYIVGNEAAERFSYYGMNSILVPFMTKYLVTRSGLPDHMSAAQADARYHFFVSCLYFLPLVGAFLADAVLGKYRTILYLSIVYCFGHLALAIDHTRFGLAIGLGLIALGAGGIKPCVSANVGDQFGSSNQHLLTRVFSWFYFSINFGSAFATILIPWLLDKRSADLAFGTPGILMLVATIIFWFGRKKFVHIPPVGARKYAKELATAENLKALGNLLILVPFAAMFWALWQQNFSSWVVQADKMDRHVFGHDWLPAQIQTVNPIFILVMLPLFSYLVYPAISKVFRLTPLRKFGTGLFITAVAFLIVGWIQIRIDAGQRPHIIWQIVAFVVLTAAEVMVSVTHLEFAYTQAPPKMKSLVMCTYLGAISLGNFFTFAVNYLMQNPDGSVKLAGASYFFFFAKVMLGVAVVFLFVSRFYRGRTYIQQESAAQAA
jgi:proton-dependent oligopeptide transporter, POT family